MRRRRRQLSILVLGAITILASQLVAVSPAQAAGAPLGKQNWVVSSAGYRTDAYRNYVRLGYLVFGSGNTVEHNFWTWNQADNPAPVNSGDVYYCGQWTPGTNPRNNCAVKTAPGFTGTPNGHFTGVYRYSSETGQVSIDWTRSTVNGTTVSVALHETWEVTEARPGLGRIRLSGDNYSLTYGIGYGSNAGLDIGSKASMSEIRTRTETFSQEGLSWQRNEVTPMDPAGPNMRSWNLCDDGSCLGMVQNNAGCGASSCCDKKRPDYAACVKRLEQVNRRFYYMSGDFGGRRNTYEFWCECLSWDECYTRNSHIRPLLQVIDDAGVFRGWVGAEVSPDRTAPRDAHGEFYASFALVA